MLRIQWIKIEIENTVWPWESCETIMSTDPLLPQELESLASIHLSSPAGTDVSPTHHLE